MGKNEAQESSWPELDRRGSYICAGCEEMAAQLAKSHEKLAAHDADIDRLKTAFIRDDLGGPDFSGHRAAHLEMTRDKQRYGELKQSGAKKVLDMLITFVVGVFVAGMAMLYRDGGPK